MGLLKSQQWMLVLTRAITDAWVDKDVREGLLKNGKDFFQNNTKYYFDFKELEKITIEFVEDTKDSGDEYWNDKFTPFDDGTPASYRFVLEINSNIVDIAKRFVDNSLQKEQCVCCCL